MSNAFAFGKKAFTWTVVVATIAWAMSAAFIAIPLTASAATTAGDLIVGTARSTSGPGRPVYYYGADGKRWLFPSSQTYKAWFGTNFSAVKEVTEAELQAIPFGGNITAKAGSLVKFSGPDSNYYVVEKGGVRRQISVADATTVYGAGYATSAYTIPESFQANYTVGAAATSSFSPTVAAAAAATIATDKSIAEAPAAPTGALSVAAASDNPSAAVVPSGSTSVVTLKFNVTAGSAAQTVTGVTIKSVGVGSANDFSAVYLYDGATRLTSGRTLTSQTRQTEFAALNIAVPANSSKTLSVVVDVAATGTATAGDTHAFQVMSLATTASVSGLPVTGASHSIGSQGVSTVVLTRGSDPANPTIGQTGVAIGEFRLTAGVNDVEVRRAVVTVGGTVTVSDLSALALYQGSTKLADGTVVSDRVTFDMASAPYALGQGTNRLFTVKANVGGRGSRTVTTYIDSTYPSDLLVVDKVYGYGATTTFTSFAAAATAASTPATGGSFVTTQGGRVTVAFNGPSASDVALGSQDVPFYKFSLTAGDQALEIREVELTLAEAGAQILGRLQNAAATTNYFTDIKVKDADTGAVLMGPVELSGATLSNAASITAASTAVWDNDLTQSWTLNAGQTRKLVVTADVASSETLANDITTRGFTFALNTFPSGSIREVSTAQNVATTDIIGGQSTVTGNTMTVRASALTVQLASTPVSGTSVKGATGVQIVGFSFAAGAQSDIKVTQIVMTGQGDDTGGTYTAAEFDDVVLTAQIYDGDTAVSNAKSPTTAGVLTFDNMNLTIPAGATKKLVARVSLATTQMSSAADTAWLGINAAADITAQDKDSNSVTATDGDATWSNPINSTPTVVLTSAASGRLTADVDGDTPLSGIILGGASGVNMTKIKFLAANEDFRVRRLRISNDAAADDTGVVQLKLTYPKQDGTMETKTGVLSSAAADFSDLNFYVPRDRTTVLTIAADFANITESGVSGDTPTLRLTFFDGTDFEAVGAASGTTLDSGTDVHGTGQTTACTDGSGVSTCYTDTSTITGNAMTVRKSKPTVTLAAASPSGASVPGLNEVLRFTVAADASGDVVFDALTFKVTSTDNAATPSGWNVNADSSGNIDLTSGWSLYESGDLTTQLEAGDGDWTLYGSAAGNGTLSDTETVGYARLVFTTARTIAAGASKTYVLKVDTTGASSSADDTVRFDIVEEGGSVNTTVAALTEFQWDEVGSGAATDVNGALVKNLPVNGGTIIY